MKKISIELSQSSYPVWIGRGILDHTSKLLGKQKVTTAFIVADLKVKRQINQLTLALEKSGWQVFLKWIRVTESFKDLRQVNSLYGWLLKNGARRDSVLFAVGGGVIGDCVGFVAGTFMRGVPWVGVPTTLLAQVDSSIGGKTGVNYKVGKNLIGVFHQPAGVVCEIDFLKTLPRRDRISGLGEVIKYGLIFDRKLFDRIVRHWSELVDLSPKVLIPVIHECLKWKAKTVESDEKDQLGIREVLNFGHTLGHALEAEVGFEKLRHGEAVLLGMRMAVHLSHLRGYLPLSDLEVIESFLTRLPIPRIAYTIPPSRLLTRLKWDKKNREGKVRFVLLKRIGEALLDQQVKPSEILEAISRTGIIHPCYNP